MNAEIYHATKSDNRIDRNLHEVDATSPLNFGTCGVMMRIGTFKPLSHRTTTHPAATHPMELCRATPNPRTSVVRKKGALICVSEAIFPACFVGEFPRKIEGPEELRASRA